MKGNAQIKVHMTVPLDVKESGFVVTFVYRLSYVHRHHPQLHLALQKLKPSFDPKRSDKPRSNLPNSRPPPRQPPVLNKHIRQRIRHP